MIRLTPRGMRRDQDKRMKGLEPSTFCMASRTEWSLEAK